MTEPQLSAEMEKRFNEALKGIVYVRKYKSTYKYSQDDDGIEIDLTEEVNGLKHFLATALEEQRQEILSEVGGWLVDEDIDIVHHFYSCRVSSEHRCPQCKKTGCEAYVYSGGMVNGRNSLRAELRAKLQEMKGENENT